MNSVGKTQFSYDVWVSPKKLDSIMEDLWLEYETSPRDKKVKVVWEDAQKAIKDYLWIN